MDTEFDAVPELVPDWNRHPRLASEMHCTIADSSQADIPYTSYPFTSKTSRLVDSTRLTPPFSPPGRAMAKSTGADITFRRPSFYFLQCGGLERHAAKPHPATSTTSSGFRAAFQRRT